MRPLAVFPWPVAPINQQRISAALQHLGINDAQPCPAVPGSPVRILAIGERLPFLHDAVAVVYVPENPQGLEAAISAVLATETDPRLSTLLDQLREIFGPGVVEVGVRFE